MTVYISINRIAYEGFDIVGVYSNKKEAIKHGNDVIAWVVNGNEIIKRRKRGDGRKQFLLNIPFLKSFDPKKIIKDLAAVKKILNTPIRRT